MGNETSKDGSIFPSPQGFRPSSNNKRVRAVATPPRTVLGQKKKCPIIVCVLGLLSRYRDDIRTKIIVLILSGQFYELS